MHTCPLGLFLEHWNSFSLFPFLITLVTLNHISSYWICVLVSGMKRPSLSLQSLTWLIIIIITTANSSHGVVCSEWVVVNEPVSHWSLSPLLFWSMFIDILHLLKIITGYRTQWTAEVSVFGTVNLWILFAYEISLEPLNGFVPNSHGRHVCSVAWMSLKVKVTRDKKNTFF